MTALSAAPARISRPAMLPTAEAPRRAQPRADVDPAGRARASRSESCALEDDSSAGGALPHPREIGLAAVADRQHQQLRHVVRMERREPGLRARRPARASSSRAAGAPPRARPRPSSGRPIAWARRRSRRRPGAPRRASAAKASASASTGSVVSTTTTAERRGSAAAGSGVEVIYFLCTNAAS